MMQFFSRLFQSPDTGFSLIAIFSAMLLYFFIPENAKLKVGKKSNTKGKKMNIACLGMCLLLGSCNLSPLFWEDESAKVLEDVVDEEENQSKAVSVERSEKTEIKPLKKMGGRNFL